MTDVDKILEEVPADVQRDIIAKKLQTWKNTIADAKLDAMVAKAVGDEQLKAQAARRLKGTLKAVAFLEQKLVETPKPEDDSS